MIAFTGLIFQPEECRGSVVPNVHTEQRIFKDSEIPWQEIEVQRAAYKMMEKYPLSLSLLPPRVCGSQTAQHKLWSKPCWNINKPTSTGGRNSACSVGTFFLDLGWQPGG